VVVSERFQQRRARKRYIYAAKPLKVVGYFCIYGTEVLNQFRSHELKEIDEQFFEFLFEYHTNSDHRCN
jgi:hypothetical protein